jgi:hypothetical protein
MYEKMLARGRGRRGEPNWAPTGMLSGGGLWFGTQVDKQLKKLYQRIAGHGVNSTRAQKKMPATSLVVRLQ